MSTKSKKIIVGGAAALSLSGLGVVDVQAAIVNSASGNVIARGEDGVPWELYDNGFLLFKPVAGKNNLLKGSWQNQKDKITGIGFSGRVFAPRDSSSLFANFTKMTYFDAANLDVTTVLNMSRMFAADTGKSMVLESVDFSNWDTGAVRDMSYMFSNNTKLKRLDLHNWKLTNLQTLEGMFAAQNAVVGLEELDISVWKYNTSDVNTHNMFLGNSKLWKISLPYVFILDYDNLGLESKIKGSTDKWKREDGKFQPYTWSELGHNWTPAMAGTWVREPASLTIEISFEMGTHPAIPKMTGVYTTNLDSSVHDDVFANFTLPTPKNPENLRFIGWGWANGGPQDDNSLKHALYFFTDTGKATLYPKWEVIPKEPKTVTEVIEPTKEFVIDETRDKGAKNLETPGKKGSKTTKITYIINPDTGVATENRGEPVIDPAGKTIVKVAAKPETRQVVGNDGNKYEETTRYTINPSNGDLTPNSTRRLVENTKAIEAINAEAKKKTDEIEAANILPEAKTRLKARVEAERTKGIDAVKRMDTVDRGNAERDKAITAIRAISLDADKKAKEAEDLAKAKEIGINAIKKAAEDKKAEINAADLLPEAKTRLLAKVEEEKNKGLEAVGEATNPRSVESETTKAVGIIKAISLESDKEAKKVQDAKTAAINAIKQAAKEKTDEIDFANLLPEAKTRLKAKVEEEKNKGIDLVGKATTVANVNSERDKAVGIIRAISLDADKKAKEAKDLGDAKNSAIDAIKKAAQDKLSEIEKVNILPEAKVRLRAQVETEKNRGINAVNGAKDIATVNNERDKAVSAIRNIGFSVDINNKLKVDNENEFNNAKSNAINEINKAAQDKKLEIDKADISPEDKTKLKNQVDSERDKGISEINKLTEVPEINKKKDLVIKTIREIDLGPAKKAKADKDLKDAKDRAIDTIKKAAERKLGEIEGANLSQEAKARLRAMVESEKNKGIDAVNKATDVNGVGVERDKAVRAIEGISLDSDRKSKDLQDAIDKSVVAIINAANKKINEIGNVDILPEAKIRLRGEVEREKTKGIEAVKKATDVNTVGVERDKAIRAIEAISVDADKKAKSDKELLDAKKFGTNAIEKAAREKLTEIENADLLPADKEKLKGQVNAEKTKGIDAVNKAMTISVAKSESDKAVEIIRGISLDQAKKAKQDLDNARRDAIKAVRDKGVEILKDLEKRNLDPKEKSRLREIINEIVDNAVKNIGVADRNGIDPIKNKAIKDLESFVPEINKLEQDKVNRDNEELSKKDLDSLKVDAKKKVTDEYNRIKGEIERSSLDDATKRELLKRLDDLYKKGLGLIDGATKDDILKIRDSIISDMNKVLDNTNARVRAKKDKEALDLDKQKAKERIKAEYEKQQNRIKSANIPAKLKAELLRELLEGYGKGISDIDGSNKETLGKVTYDTVRDLIGIGDKAVAAEQEEAERLAREKEEADRLTREKQEAERLEREKEEAERLAREKAERERIEKELLERAEADRLAREKAERERLEKERLARAEADRLAREKAEKERLAHEKAERERLEKERLAKEKSNIKPVESKTATVKLEDVKPTVKQVKLPETGASETASYGLFALALGLVAKLRRRKN